jgi:hypothetical protein
VSKIVSDSLVLRILENTQEWVNDYLVSKIHCEQDCERLTASKIVSDYLVLRIHCEQDCERLFSFENTLEVVIKYFKFALSLGMEV